MFYLLIDTDKSKRFDRTAISRVMKKLFEILPTIRARSTTELKFKLNYSFINRKRIIFLGISGIFKFSTRYIFYRGVRNAKTSLHLLHSRGIHPPRSTVIPAWDLSHSRGKADFFLEADSPPSIQLKIRSIICNRLCWWNNVYNL